MNIVILSLLQFISAISFLAFVQAEHCDVLKRELERLDAKFFDNSQASNLFIEKHTPFFMSSTSAEEVDIVIGKQDNFHPIKTTVGSVHFITYVYVVDQDEKLLDVMTLDPSARTIPIKATVKIPKDVSKIKAYAFCNLHGLFAGEWYNVQSGTSTREPCAVEAPVEAAFPTYHLDFKRRQDAEFNSQNAYTETDDNKKHIPYVTLSDDKSTGTVVVGVEGEYHPMNTEAPHWITDLYVLNEKNEIIYWKTLDPTGKDTATTTFSIPAGTKKVTVYSWCNIHGLYVGPTYDVEAPTSISNINSFSIALVTFLYGFSQVGLEIIA